MKSWIATILALSSLRAFAAGPVVIRDLAYAGPPGGPRSLDIYAPAEGANHPVVLWIHGGGWQYGDKADLQMGAVDQVVRKPHAFVENGFVFVSINYRLLPTATLAQMAQDVAQAIGWVHGNIKAHGGDPESIFVMGHSAGAQLAALVCTDGSYLEHEGLSLNAVRGCVPVDGDTYYPELQIDLEPEAATVNSYLLKFPDTITQKSLSSVLHVSKGKPIPPFLLLHVADHPESHTDMQAEILGEALREAGIPVRVLACPGKTHDTLNADLGLSGDGPTEAIFAFLREQLK
jgi:acetyl esterase/lipase